MRKSKKVAKLTLQLSGVFIGVLLIFLVLVPLFGPGWHLLHGDFISYGGWRIPVPKGFYVRNSQGRPTMWRLNLGIPLFRAPYGHISLFSHPPQEPPAFDYRRFERAVIEDALRSGYQLKAKRTVSVGKNSAYCLEFTRSSGEPRSLVRCVVENSVLVLFYEGDPRYIPDVFTTLQGMSLESAGGGSSYDYDGRNRPIWTYDASTLHLRRLLPACALGHVFAVRHDLGRFRLLSLRRRATRHHRDQRQQL